MKIFFGSHNKHKLKEMRRLLPDLDLDLIPQEIPAVSEDGQSFSENARLKSSYYASKINQWVLADDSGLCVEALGGAPGIHSARYAGPEQNDHANNQKLLKTLKEEKNRRAYFVCVLSLASPNTEILQVQGKCQGTILEHVDGQAGFGYDPLFYSDELQKSFGYALEQEKDRVSHRARACQNFIQEFSQLSL